MNRRSFFKKSALAGVAGAFTPLVLSSAPLRTNQRRLVRVAHITDVHLLDQKNAEVCFARVLSEINSMPDKPDFIINTGDTVMDENNQTRETVATRWKVWNETVATNKLPIYSALGNHDVWYHKDKKLDENYRADKRYGKQWAMDMLALKNRYYSFEKNGWKFVALDSINGATGYQLDDEQFEWLSAELKATPASTPVLVFNHVPIISAGAMLYLTQRTPAIEAKFPSGDMHLDHQRIKNLFAQYKQVKVCLSGHVHYVDRVDYLGVTYLCNGAVSGNWWGNPIALDEFPPAYAIIDLYDDGSIDNQIVYYNHTVS